MSSADAYVLDHYGRTYSRRQVYDRTPPSGRTNMIGLYRRWDEWANHATYPRWAGIQQHVMRMRAIADRAIEAHDRLAARRR